MCFELNNDSKIKTATKNIPVWKRVYKQDKRACRWQDPSNGNYDPKAPAETTLESAFYRFPYYRGRVYTPVKLKIDAGEIEEGFHAYTSWKEADDRKWDDEQVVKMIVPKGAQYITNAGGEIVSSHIRFPKKGE